MQESCLRMYQKCKDVSLKFDINYKQNKITHQYMSSEKKMNDIMNERRKIMINDCR